jgi:uncharacterized protein (DUF2141 family)
MYSMEEALAWVWVAWSEAEGTVTLKVDGEKRRREEIRSQAKPHMWGARELHWKNRRIAQS